MGRESGQGIAGRAAAVHVCVVGVHSDAEIKLKVRNAQVRNAQVRNAQVRNAQVRNAQVRNQAQTYKRAAGYGMT
eukprot:363579-Chlamydomonas_euryale.AAC.3